MLDRKRTKKEFKKLKKDKSDSMRSQASFIKAESALKMNNKTDSEISMNFDSNPQTIVDMENQPIKPHRSSEKRVKPLISPIPEAPSNETMETPFEATQ